MSDGVVARLAAVHARIVRAAARAGRRAEERVCCRVRVHDEALLVHDDHGIGVALEQRVRNEVRGRVCSAPDEKVRRLFIRNGEREERHVEIAVLGIELEECVRDCPGLVE